MTGLPHAVSKSDGFVGRLLPVSQWTESSVLPKFHPIFISFTIFIAVVSLKVGFFSPVLSRSFPLSSFLFAVLTVVVDLLASVTLLVLEGLLVDLTVVVVVFVVVSLK